MFASMLDSIQECACGNLAHFLQWLTNRGQRRVARRRQLNIVETNYRNILGNTQSGILYRLDRRDGELSLYAKRAVNARFRLNSSFANGYAYSGARAAHRLGSLSSTTRSGWIRIPSSRRSL